jgi:methylenetetrahydrofolate reductase (NADPH)
LRLSEIYANHSPAISVEFFPPRTPEGEEDLAMRIVEIARLRPAFCSVTYGAGGSNRDRTLFWVRRIKKEFGLEVMCHLTCVGQSRAEIDEVLSQLEAEGVENIIALRGDPPKTETCWQPHPEGFHYAAELVAAAKARGFAVAVAGFPEIHPESTDRASDLRFLKQKVNAGADAIITQLFFHNQDYFDYLGAARQHGITVPIIPGLLPFRSEEELRRFTTKYARTMSGPARVPDELEELLAETAGDETRQAKLGIDWAVRQAEELLAQGAPGIHLYCMNKSNMVEAIITRLRASGALK